jgi:hypothetical protein
MVNGNAEPEDNGNDQPHNVEQSLFVCMNDTLL